jgi:hypothetical protein
MHAMSSGGTEPAIGHVRASNPPERPSSAAWLGRLLLLELAIAVLLVGLSLLGALAAALALRSNGRSGFADLALVVLLVVAAAGAVLAGVDLAAWIAVRRRSRSALPLAVLAHLLLLPLVGWLVSAGAPGRALTAAGLGLLAVLGLVLTLAPATRAWLRPR